MAVLANSSLVLQELHANMAIQARIRSAAAAAADREPAAELAVQVETTFDKHEVTLASDVATVRAVETRGKRRSSRGDFFGAREDYTALAGLGQDVQEVGSHILLHRMLAITAVKSFVSNFDDCALCLRLCMLCDCTHADVLQVCMQK